MGGCPKLLESDVSRGHREGHIYGEGKADLLVTLCKSGHRGRKPADRGNREGGPNPLGGCSPMLECFRRRQIRASLSSFW